MNVRCQWLPTVRVRNHIRSHVGQHFQVRLADFVDLAQRGVFHNSSPSSALHGTFDAKRTVISRWDLTSSRGTKSIARASKRKVPLMPCSRLLVLPGPFHSYQWQLAPFQTECVQPSPGTLQDSVPLDIHQAAFELVGSFRSS